jgi:regulator of protease activity HflC (stomatin/prohibitin superfamily)
MKKIYSLLTLLITLLIILVLWDRVIITVRAGEGGVLFKRWGGTVIDKIYGEGIHTIFPWNIMTNYNLRIQEKRHNFSVLSKQGLNINIKISIRFRPEESTIGVMHQKIGPNYIKSVVVPEVESVIRRYFGNFNDEEIYTSKGAILEKIRDNATKQLLDKYIILDELIIRSIEFPKAVKDAIQAKIIQYHKYKAYDYRIERAKLEANRKIIEANGISRYKDIISKNITKDYLTWEGIQATVKLATASNSKVIIIGSGKNGLPIILNTEESQIVKQEENRSNEN